MASLTGKQRAIVVAMVDAHRKQQEEFCWYGTMAGCQVEGCDVSLPASRDDVVTLHQAGLISAQDHSDSIAINLKPEAYHAVRSFFGIARDRFVLEALYSLAKATTEHVNFENLVEATGMEDGQVREMGAFLSREKGFVHMNNFGLRLTPAGIVAAESAPEKPTVAAPPSTVSIQYNFSNGGSVVVQNGNGNTASAVQNYGTAAADLLPLVKAIRESLSELPADKQADAAEHVADIEAEIKSGRAKKSVLTGAKAWLAAAAMGTATFAQNVEKFSAALEHTEANVIKMVHDVPGQ